MKSRKKLGDKGELIAIKYLQKNGYKIIDTNFKFGKYGEVDVIGTISSLIIFIEVKYRNNLNFGLPEDSVNKQKLRKVKKTIDYYCFKNNISHEKIRFDVISILKGESSYKITHYKNLGIE